MDRIITQPFVSLKNGISLPFVELPDLVGTESWELIFGSDNNASSFSEGASGAKISVQLVS